MNVLHLISSGGMYGAEAVILQLTTGMQAAAEGSSRLSVFAHAGAEIPQLHRIAKNAGIASELLNCRGQVDLRVLRELREVVRRAQIDVIHAHGYKADIYAFLAFRRGARPALVSTCHTWYDNDLAVRVYGAADRWVLRGFDEVVAVSEDVCRRLRAAGIAERHIHLIQNGVELPGSGARGEDEERTQADKDRFRVGLVGRLAPEKGVDIFLQAAAMVTAVRDDVQFVVAGEGPDRERLEALRRTLGLVETAHLLGRQTDMPGFYASLDLLVSASRHEGLPVALLEGMANGLPVVATTVGEVPRVVLQGETGLLVPPGSAGELAQAIMSMLDHPDRRERFGAAARQRVQSHFSAQRMISEYVAVYREALKERDLKGKAPQKTASRT